MKWQYGVTAVPKRFNNVLPRTLASLAKGGFDKPRIFVDGASQAYPGYECTVRNPAVRTFGNWYLSLLELWIRDPNANRYALFQDDFVCCANFRKYLELWYPTKGYMNCYTFPSNEQIAPKGGGWYEARIVDPSRPHLQTGRSAIALVFSHEAVRVLLKAPTLVDKPMDSSDGWRKADGACVNAMNLAGWREYVHYPSLTQHTGQFSSMGHGPYPPSNSFPGEEWDPTSTSPVQTSELPSHPSTAAEPAPAISG